MRILIAGCGDVGGALGRLLAAEGHRVWGLRRTVSKLPPELEPIAADLTDPATLADLPEGLDEVVYAAAADGRGEDAYRAAYSEGVARLLTALDAQGQHPRRVIFVSSTGVYGQSDGEWVDESSTTEPGRFTGRIVLEAERRVLGGPFPGTAVRFGGIYGPGRTRLLERVRAGDAEVPAGRPVYTNRIHRDDCAGVLAHLLARDRGGRPLEPVYLGVDHEPAELGEVFRYLAELLDAAPPEVAEDADTGRRGSNKRCRNDRLVATGYRFLYPTYREGYRALVGGG